MGFVSARQKEQEETGQPNREDEAGDEEFPREVTMLADITMEVSFTATVNSEEELQEFKDRFWKGDEIDFHDVNHEWDAEYSINDSVGWVSEISGFEEGRD